MTNLPEKVTHWLERAEGHHCENKGIDSVHLWTVNVRERTDELSPKDTAKTDSDAGASLKCRSTKSGFLATH
jgi:hypothetical protein